MSRPLLLFRIYHLRQSDSFFCHCISLFHQPEPYAATVKIYIDNCHPHMLMEFQDSGRVGQAADTHL